MSGIIIQYPTQQEMYNPNRPTLKKRLIQEKENKSPISNERTQNVVNRLYVKEKMKYQTDNYKEIQRVSPIKCAYVTKNSQKILEQMHLKPFLARQEEQIRNKEAKLQQIRLLEQLEKERELTPIQIIPSRSQDKFLRDSEAWLMEKNRKCEQLREELKDSSTFRPQINQRSNKIIEQKIRNSSISPIITDRLQKKNPQIQTEQFSYSPQINARSRVLALKNPKKSHKYL